MKKYKVYNDQRNYKLEDIEFRIVYSGRKTLGISVLPDSSVIVRAPFRASLKTITGIVHEKAGWIIRHRDNYRQKESIRLNGRLAAGEHQLFRGREYKLDIISSEKSFVRFGENRIEMGLENYQDQESVRKLLYKGFRAEASRVFPEMLSRILKLHEARMFRPTGLALRSMKSRWGSCSARGKITLSTELIKLPDIHIEYVIVHELCHLRHHNHGKEFYSLLSELLPGWEKTRSELRGFIH